jgi:hypothetical protein
MDVPRRTLLPAWCDKEPAADCTFMAPLWLHFNWIFCCLLCALADALCKLNYEFRMFARHKIDSSDRGLNDCFII